MKRLIIKPADWACTLMECPPGYFVFNDHLCFKSEYTYTDKNGPYQIEAHGETGEAFWGGTSKHSDRAEVFVQPVKVEWEEYE